METLSIRNWNAKKLEINGFSNYSTYLYFFNRIKMLTTILYEWKNLPNNIPPRFIENQLFYYGTLAFINHPTYGFMVTRCNPSSKVNFYGDPTEVNCSAINGFNYRVKTAECVIINNNADNIPTMSFVNDTCKRLADITRIIDVNIFQQKMPKIIKCEESQKLTIKNLLMKVEGNEPYILGSKGLDLEGIEIFDTSSPYIADNLFDLKDKIWIELLTMLGINNANTSKRERLVSDEVNANNQYLSLESETMLYYRQQACEQINSMFGLNVQCELRKKLNLDEVEKEKEEQKEENL